MNKHIAIICSTVKEIAPLLSSKKIKTISEDELYVYVTDEFDKVDIIISGASAIPLMYRYTRYLSAFAQPDVVIQAGIAGAYDTNIIPGTLVEVTEEIITGYGAEDKEGTYLDMYALGLWHEGQRPFSKNRSIINHLPVFEDLPKVKGLTVNITSGQSSTINRIKTQFPGVNIETMEGAPFFYVSTMMKTKFAQIRSISNIVEPRDRSNWRIEEAIDSLNVFLLNWLP